MSEEFFKYIAQGNYQKAKEYVGFSSIYQYILMQQEGTLLLHSDEFVKYYKSLEINSMLQKKAQILCTYIHVFQKQMSDLEPQMQQSQIFVKQLQGMEQKYYLTLTKINIARFKFLSNQPNKAIALLTRYIDSTKHTNYNIRIHNLLGLIYNSQKKYALAIEQYSEALALAKNTGIKRLEIIAKGNLADCYINFGEMDAAETIFKQLLTIFEENDDYYNTAYSLKLLGKIAQLKGEYELAEQNYLASLEFSMQIKNKRGIAMTLYSLANLANAQFNYLKSIEYLQVAEKAYSDEFLISSKYYLLFIENYINLEDIVNAKKYYAKINAVANLCKEKSIQHIRRLAEAIVWKAHPRMFQKALAYDILRDLSEDPTIDAEILLKVLTEYLEILIMELLIKQSSSLEIEISVLVSRISDYATSFKSPIISLELLRINALFYLNTHNFTAYKKTINEIQQLILPTSLLTAVVSKLDSKFSKTLNNLIDFESKNKPLIENQKLDSYMAYLQEVSKVLANTKQVST